MKIRWLDLLVLFVLLVLLTSCACYPPNRLKELEREMVATKAGVYKLYLLKQQEMRQKEICKKLDIPAPCKGTPLVSKQKTERVEKIIPAPKPESKTWVFQAEKAGDKIKIMVNKALIRRPEQDETVYWVGDQQGWFSKQYPMETERDAYITYMAIKGNTGRHRSNFVVMDKGAIHSTRDWGIFEPMGDPKWVKRGDLTPDGHYAYCIMFYVQPDGQVTSTD